MSSRSLNKSSIADFSAYKEKQEVEKDVFEMWVKGMKEETHKAFFEDILMISDEGKVSDMSQFPRANAVDKSTLSLIGQGAMAIYEVGLERFHSIKVPTKEDLELDLEVKHMTEHERALVKRRIQQLREREETQSKEQQVLSYLIEKERILHDELINISNQIRTYVNCLLLSTT